MKFITFIAEFESVNPKYKHALITGMKWGMWFGGIVFALIFSIMRVFNII